jgi:hypothetical protein
MNRQTEELALRKQLLVARSALCRLKIRREAGALREGLTWRNAATAVANSSPARAAAFDLVLEGLGRDRMSRALAFASRALMVARITRMVLSLLRGSPTGSQGR